MRDILRTRASLEAQGIPLPCLSGDAASDAESLLQAVGESLRGCPLPGRPPRSVVRFSDEAKTALLKAISEHQWTTAREAYGWLWTQLGIRVSYQTVWRFLNSKGLYSGDTLHGRRLKTAC